MPSKEGRWRLAAATAAFLLLFAWICSPAAAQDSESLQRDTQELREQLQKLQEQMNSLQNKLQKTEEKLQESKKEQDWNSEDIKDLNQRVAQAERHTAADKLELSVELEPRLWSIHMDDVRTSFGTIQDVLPAMEGKQFTAEQMQAFLNGNAQSPALAPLFGANSPFSQQEQAQLAGIFPDLKNPPEADVDYDAVRTLRFRLRMDAKVNDNLRFAGRLAAYKVWGDSIGINFNKSGFQDVTLDGTSASNPHGDDILLERAYFVYDNEFANIPWYISIGRRPSTEGPPLQLKKNLPAVGGSPYAHVINWQFDGASLNFNLEEVLGIPGFDIRLCYGSGFENQYGTSSAFLSEPETDDVDLYGVIGTLYEDYLPQADLDLKIGYNYAIAPNISDGFAGLTVQPFLVNKDETTGRFSFTSNEQNMFVSRVEPSTNIGDWQALSLGAMANTLEGNLDLFLSAAWSHTKAERVSENPLYEMLGMSLLSSGGDLESHDGWSIYTGARYTLSEYKAKLGLEYNYGSRYWFNFTGAEDNLIGSKLATRGHVVEPYYIQSIVNDNLFFRLGAQFYWFNYSGSGNPLGKPVDVDEVTGMDSIFPVIDEMQQYYLSVVFRY